jgi:K+-sensing histidine kinase KdpD
MQSIIDRCVDTERLESGGYQVQPQALNLVNLVNLVKLAIVAHPGCPVSLEAAAHLPVVNADAQLLQIILNNLIDNACKYSQDNSPIGLKIAEKSLPNHGRGIQLEITNLPGRAGFPDEHQLFAKYYRSAGATSQSGSGLGLFLAHKLAIGMGAQLSYTADTPFVKFSLWLPV